ncbi:NfeD family protein [Azospirillum canadense]|uniref:NfeD family protein n=1 Tax=Azospirillum canadense TaxID=403962 RepID=UPI0022273DCB|nr:NfeD family protein [Azospirillum canadense]MCW2237793.1 membrane protein implicated in regulation of membrane protease activity [Azospirillum canadense]
MIEFWHWWVLAALLGAVEILAPGAAFLWLGGAAGLVGLALFVWPGMSWELQGLLFALLAIAAVVGVRMLAARSAHTTSTPNLNRRAEQYIGTMHTLDSPIVNGLGRAQVGDGLWTVVGPDLPAGTRVRVVGADGTRLKVEKI